MPVKWIAEIGSNHNRSWERIIKLIVMAKAIGCDAVKFQFFNPEKLYAPEFKDQINKMKKWALPYDFIPGIKIRCALENIEFGGSVFDLESLYFAEACVDWLKIGNYELLYTDLIEAVIKTRKPWMISIGMESFGHNDRLPDWPNDYLKNIREAISKGILSVAPSNPPFAILYCNSNYPAKPENCNLRNIKRLSNLVAKNIFNIKAGWSDHTTEPGIIYKVIEMGAEVIEFHFDLGDGLGFESKIGHCWKPDKIEEVIRNVKIGELACQENDTDETEAKKWRTDPEDGMRPMKEFREELLK